MDKSEIIQQNKDLRNNVKELKKKIRDVSKNKEFWFNKKEELKQIIKEKIQGITSAKTTTDKNNVGIQELKKKRDKYNKEVKNLISEIKTLNKEKQKFLDKNQIKGNPSKIAKEIDDLEKQVEIEVSFKKEQELMEKIKKLKKSYTEVAGIQELFKKADVVSKKIEDSKKKSQEIHEQIQQGAKGSGYSSILDNAKDLSKIKKEQEEAFQKFIDFKNDFNKINKELKVSSKKLNVIDKDLNKDKDARKKKKEAIVREIIEKKTKAVEEKIKKGTKLTTEDLIAFQARK